MLTFHCPEKLPALFAALALAQAEYKPIIRDCLVVQKLKNKQTGEYTGASIKFLYADLAQILEKTIPALAKNGLSFLQPIETAEDNAIWVVSILAHQDGAAIISKNLVPQAKDMKDLGGNITYLRRYAAGPALGVSAEDDADDDEDRERGAPPPPPRRMEPRATQSSTRAERDQDSAAELAPSSTAQGGTSALATPGEIQHIKQRAAAAGKDVNEMIKAAGLENLDATLAFLTKDGFRTLKALLN